MLTLTLLLGTLITSIPPVKASSTVRIYIKPEFPAWIPGVAANDLFNAEVWIESPAAWDNTIDGIVGWSLYCRMDSAVLMPYDVNDGTGSPPGTFLRDFIDDNFYPVKYRPAMSTINTNATHYIDLAEVLTSWEEIMVGAGGSGLLCNLTIRSKSISAYSILDLFEVYYYTTAGGAEGKVPADIVLDGHYNEYTGFLFLHSTSSLINLADPETTSWQDLYPTNESAYNLNDWVDSDSDGNLSYCDYIQLNSTWYHVERVTVTIYIYDSAQGKHYYHYLEFLGWEEHMDEAIADPLNTLWHQVYGEWTGDGPNPAHEFCHVFNMTDWTDDTSGNLTAGDDIEFDHKVGNPGVAWEVLEVSTGIVVTLGEVMPEFPLGAALEIGLIVAIAYVLWRSRRKTKITKQAKLAH